MTERAGLRRRRARVGVAGFLALFALVVSGIIGDRGLRAAVDPAGEVRFVELSADEIASRIDANWTRIDRARLDRLIEQIKSRKTHPAAFQVRSAVYEATFDGRELKSGRLRMRVRRNNDNSSWLNLGRCNLAVSKLESGSRELIWGRSPDGRLMAKLDADHRSISGDWTFPGRRDERSVRFPIELIPATVSRLRIAAPANWRFEAGAAETTSRPDPQRPGVVNWTFEVSGRRSISLLATPKPDVNRIAPRILASADTTYGVRESGLQLESRVSLQVLDEPIRRVRFRVPKSVNVYRVDYDLKIPLNFTRRAAGRDAIVTVTLPDPLLGNSRPITLYGVGETTLSSMWTLPAIDVLRADFVSAVIHLQVGKPLRLKRVATNGMHQSAPVATAENSETMTLQQTQSQARLRVVVDRETPYASGRAVTHLDISTQRCLATMQLRITAHRGPVHEIALQVGRDWVIRSMTMFDEGDDETGRAVNWNDSSGGDRLRTLTAILPRAAVAGKLVRLQIVGESTAASNRQRVRLPIVTPHNVRIDRSTVLISHTRDTRPELQNGGNYQKRNGADFDGLIKRHRLGLLPPRTAGRMVIESTARLSRGVLDFRGQRNGTNARAWTICEPGDDALIERFAVTIQPGGIATRRLHVLITSPGPAIQWHPAGKVRAALPARKVNPAVLFGRRASISGEIWEIDLPRGPAAEITITGQRRRKPAASIEPALVSVPMAAQFEGYLELRQSKPSAVATRDLFPVRDIAAAMPFRPASEPPIAASTRLWRYQSMSPSLVLRTRGWTTRTKSAVIHSVDLWSVIGPTATSRNRHRATYRLRSQPGPGHLELSVPDEVRIDRVLLNGRQIVEAKHRNRIRVGDLPPGKPNVVIAEYSSPAAPIGWKSPASIPLPGTSQKVRNVRWQIALPRHLEPLNGSGSNVLFDSAPDVGWPRRMFGPLARTPDATPGNSGSTARRRDAFVPDDWIVYRGTLPQLPGSIAFDLSDRRVGRRWAWVGMLACLLVGWFLRRRQYEFRIRFGSWWLCGCLVAAVIVPAYLAEFVGACIVGTLVAILTPRRLIRRPATSEPSLHGIPMGSTVSYPRIAGSGSVASLLWLIALGTAVGGMQPAVPMKDADRPPVIHKSTILLTTDPTTNKPTGTAWVHRELLARLRKESAAPDKPPPYVIRRADYDVELVGTDSADLTAEFEVIRVAGNESGAIALPIANAHLNGRGACRVNGRRQPVRQAASGRGFEVDLPEFQGRAGESRIDRVQLRLRLALKGDLAERTATLGVPAVPASRLLVTTNLDDRRLSTRELTDVTRTDAWFSRSVLGRFGPRTKLQLRFRAPGSTVASTRPIKADLHGLVEFTPTLSRYRYHIRYTGLTQPVGQVVWRIPDGWSVEDVQAVVPADDQRAVDPMAESGRLRVRTEPADRGYRRVLVSLAQPRSKPFELNATFVAPHRARAAQLRIAMPRLHATGSQTGGNSDRVIEEQHSVAIVAPVDFELEVGSIRSAALKPIPRENQTAFRELFNLARNPNAAYQLSDSAFVRGRLKRITAVRQLQVRQAVSIEGERLRIRYETRAAISAAAVARHELTIPPGFEVDSAGVIEDDAPRLVRWAQSGNRLTLFLSEQSLGVQNIVIEGTMRVPRGNALDIPRLRMLDAQLESSRIELFRDATSAVALSAANGAQSGEAEKPTMTSAGWFVAGFDGKQPRLPLVRIGSRKGSLRVDRLTTVKPSASGGYAIRYLFRVRDRFPRSGVLLSVPRQLQLELIDPRGNWSVARRPQPGGRTVWLLKQRSPQRDALIVFQTTVDRGDKLMDSLPMPDVVTVDPATDLLAITNKENRWKPADSGEPLPRTLWPAWLTPLVDRDARIYKNAGRRWRISTNRNRPTGGELVVSLMDTCVWSIADRPWAGRTELYVLSPGRSPLELHWPKSLKLDRVRLDDRIVPVRPMNSGRLVIPLDAAAQHVRLDWRGARERRLPAVAVVTLDLPRLQGTKPARNFVRMLTPGTRRYSDFTGMQPASVIALQLERIRLLLSFASAGADADGAAAGAWHSALREYKQLRRMVARLPADDEREKKLRQLDADLKQLAKRFAKSAPAHPTEFPAGVNDAAGWQGIIDAANPPAAVRFRVMDRRFARGLLAIVIVILLLPATSFIFRRQLGDILARWEPVSWTLLGTVWWLFLTPWVLGPAFLALAAFKTGVRIRDYYKGNRVIRVADHSAA